MSPTLTGEFFTDESPGKSNVYTLLYIKCITNKNLHESHSVMSDSLQPNGLYSLWNSPGQNTGVGSHPLLQGIFPTQGLNPGLLYCRRILCHLSHQGSPRVASFAPLHNSLLIHLCWRNDWHLACFRSTRYTPS